MRTSAISCARTPATKGGFHNVFAAPDDPSTIDEAKALSLVILRLRRRIAGTVWAKLAAADAVSGSLMRCRASQRRFRNTLIFVAADEACSVMLAKSCARRSLGRSIDKDDRLQSSLTQAQAADTNDKARKNRDGARTRRFVPRGAISSIP